jgi:hypothetical protein
MAIKKYKSEDEEQQATLKALQAFFLEILLPTDPNGCRGLSVAFVTMLFSFVFYM